MTAHAKLFPPSAASRWMSCTASPLLIKELLEDDVLVPGAPGKAAVTGTAMHSGAEHVLLDDSRDARRDLPGFRCPDTGIVLTQDHAELVDDYVKLVRGKRDKDGGMLRVEQVVHLNEFCYGTADAQVVSPKRLRVWDLKTGNNIVFAKDNYQLGIYGAASLLDLMDLYDFETVELGISQPSLGHVDRVIHNPASLLELRDRVEETIGVVLAGRGVFAPDRDTTCRWCPAAPLCPALRRDKVAVAVRDFSEVLEEESRDTELEVAVLDEGQALDWGDRLELVPIIRLWCDKVEASAKQMMLGKVVPDGDSLGEKFKVVEGRSGNRFFEDPVTAIATLAKEFGLDDPSLLYSPPEPRSPSSVEKILATTEAGEVMKKKEIKEKVDKLTSRQPGSPTIVPIGDPREPVDKLDGAIKDFADVIDDTDAE